MENLKDLKVHNEGNVDRDYIVKEATALYEQCLKEATEANVNVKKIIAGTGRPSKSDIDYLDFLFGTMRKEHKQLFETYPTVVRHMIQELQFDKNVFNKYLMGLEKKPWMNDSQRMDSYTDYALLLYKHTNSGKHPSKTQLELFKKDYRKRLQDEHDEFMKTVEAHKARIEKESAGYDESRKQDLIAIIKKQIAESDARTTKQNNERGDSPSGDSSPASDISAEDREMLIKAGIIKK